jgi:hypothetical protein
MARATADATARLTPQAAAVANDPLVHQRLFIPNTNGVAFCTWLVTSPFSAKIFFSTCKSVHFRRSAA